MTKLNENMKESKCCKLYINDDALSLHDRAYLNIEVLWNQPKTTLIPQVLG